LSFTLNILSWRLIWWNFCPSGRSILRLYWKQEIHFIFYETKI
jgi:hypothetical protein